MLKTIRMSRGLGTFIVIGAVVASVGGIMLARQAAAADLSGTVESVSGDGTSLTVNGQTLIITAQTEIDGTLAAGAAIEADVATQADGSLVALEVSVADSEDVNDENDSTDEDTHNADEDIDQEETELSGTIDSLSADGTSLVVDGQTLLITPETEIDGTLAVGAAIEADVATQADGSLVALDVSVADSEDVNDENDSTDEDTHNADEDIDQEETELSGTIDSLSADGTSLVVDGQTLLITAQTEIDGTLAVGAAIEADVATQADGSLVALEVSVADSEDVNEESDNANEDVRAQHASENAQLRERVHTRAGEDAHSADEDIDQREDEISGTIDSMSTDGTSLVVDGQTLIITAQTEIEGTLAVGANVEADVATQADGSLVALDVSMENGKD